MSVFLRKGSPNYVSEFKYKGHRFSRSTFKSVERDARAVERQYRAEFKAEIDKRESAAGAPWTLDQIFGEYWEKIAKPEKKKLAPAWSKEVERYSTLILTIIDKNMLAQDVTDREVEIFVDAYENKGAGKYAINRALAVWRRVHNLAKRRWKQKMQVIDWAEFLNREHKRTAHLEVAEAEHLLSISPKDLAEPIEWSLYTGCRWFETYGLAWERVDLGAGKAVVIAKGGREHTVWLTPATLDLLARVPRLGRYVFSKTNWRRNWDAARNKIGKPKLRWHDLRHTHATWLGDIAGAPIEVVQRSCGHADLETTMRYRHVRDPELYKALQKLPSLGTSTPKVVPFIRDKSSA